MPHNKCAMVEIASLLSLHSTAYISMRCCCYFVVVVADDDGGSAADDGVACLTGFNKINRII